MVGPFSETSCEVCGDVCLELRREDLDQFILSVQSIDFEYSANMISQVNLSFSSN